jgi:hypothetical protein
VALPGREPLFNEMTHAPIHRVPHLGAESSCGCNWRAGDKLPVEPGRAGGNNLLSEGEVGPSGER